MKPFVVSVLDLYMAYIHNDAATKGTEDQMFDTLMLMFEDIVTTDIGGYIFKLNLESNDSAYVVLEAIWDKLNNPISVVVCHGDAVSVVDMLKAVEPILRGVLIDFIDDIIVMLLRMVFCTNEDDIRLDGAALMHEMTICYFNNVVTHACRRGYKCNANTPQ